MALFVCIAGLPQEAVNEVERNPARYSREETNLPIVRAISGERSFRYGMSDFYINKLYDKIRALPAKEDVSIVMAYANYLGTGTDQFLGAFFPFAATVPFEPFYYDVAPKHERRAKLNCFLDGLADKLKALCDGALQMKDKLSGQNFSPLTLPVRNFRSDIVRPTIETLFTELGHSDDPAAAIDAAIKAILSYHPVSRIPYEECNHTSDLKKPYFRDDRRLRFKSPGGDLHGLMLEVADGHNKACLLSSRVRIGGPIISGMHYDCDYFPDLKVNDIFANCHDQPTRAKKTSHANIAPSDAVW